MMVGCCAPSSQGDFQFLNAIEGHKLNLGCGHDIRSPSEGWVNMDLYAKAPTILQHDISVTPWPFRDATFDIIYASYSLEHIPHVYDLEGRDALFRLFDEAHRILKPGGRFFIRVPWGLGHSSVVHPQHYRHFLPEWFYHLRPTHPESYYVQKHWRVVDWQRTRGIVHHVMPYLCPLGPQRLGLTTHLAIRLPMLRPLIQRPGELYVTLEKI